MFSRIKEFFGCISSVIELFQLPDDKRQIVFYSENKTYWTHFEGLINELLNEDDVHICYVSSGRDDPGLHLIHSNISGFLIDQGFVRNWLFENLNAKIMVMSMPDLGNFQVKRSRYPVHYIYTQHSLVSLHMVYRKGAHDNYDTIFCAGPHHNKEIRALEKCYGLPEKQLFNHGYSRLDSIIRLANDRPARAKHPKVHVLVAPSWGDNAIIEMIGDELMDILLENNFAVTLRPHPQTIKFSADRLQAIANKHKENPDFTAEYNVSDQESLHQSDVMISDWSGAAWDYAFGLSKPVVFIDVPRKINNPSYTDIDDEPMEVIIRNVIGEVISPEKLSELPAVITKALMNFDSRFDVNDYVYNVGCSDRSGKKEILNILSKL